MNTVDKDIIQKAKTLAENMVISAGAYLIKHKHQFKIVNYKDIQDIVTSVDLAVEKQIIEKIETEFPSHNIFSEEVGVIDKGSDFTWVIDPLDGTKEYVRDIPLYCSAVMLERKGELLVSAVFDPELNELYSAGLGVGAFLNNEPIHVSKQNDLKKSFLFTYLPRNSTEAKKLSPLFDSAYRIRGHANHNMSYCWVAKGGYEGHFSLFTPQHWWDVAPGILILQEAGGKITNLQGKDLNHNSYSVVAIGTNGLIHESLLIECKKALK